MASKQFEPDRVKALVGIINVLSHQLSNPELADSAYAPIARALMDAHREYEALTGVVEEEEVAENPVLSLLKRREEKKTG